MELIIRILLIAFLTLDVITAFLLIGVRRQPITLPGALFIFLINGAFIATVVVVL